MFLEGIERSQRALREKFARIWQIIDHAMMPGKDGAGAMINIKVPPDERGRLDYMTEVHGIASARAGAYKAMLLGLEVMESLPVRDELPPPTPVPGRVLSEDEVSMIRDEGFNCPREGRPERNPYAEDGGERIMLNIEDEEDDED